MKASIRGGTSDCKVHPYLSKRQPYNFCPHAIKYAGLFLKSFARSADTTSTAAAPSFSWQQSYKWWNGSMIQRELSYFSSVSSRPRITALGFFCAWW